jgi:hypothetical protein
VFGKLHGHLQINLLEAIVLFEYGLEMFEFLQFGPHFLILGRSEMTEFLVFKREEFYSTLQKVTLLLVTLILLLEFANK